MSQRHTVILVGAGHVHLYVAAHAEALIERGARVVLVDPGEFWYSGLATGMLGGMYEPAEDQVDPRALIEAHQLCVAPRWRPGGGSDQAGGIRRNTCDETRSRHSELVRQ